MFNASGPAYARDSSLRLSDLSLVELINSAKATAGRVEAEQL